MLTQAQLSLFDIGSFTNITFDTTVSGVNNGQFAGTGFSPLPGIGLLDSDAWAVSNTSSATLTFGGTQTSGTFANGTSAGGVSTGGIYAFTVGTGNNALGVQPSGSAFAPGSITLRLQNNTGVTLTEFGVGYTVYVRNDQARANSFNFSYSGDGSSYTGVASLNLTSPEASSGSTWTANGRSTTLTGLSVADGAYFYVQWSGADVSGGGSRDEFALDDIGFSNLVYAVPTTMYWDVNGSTAGIGGAGTWSTTTSNFNGRSAGTGGSRLAFDSSSKAVFGGTAGLVTLGGAISANQLQFLANGYEITANTLTLNGSTPTVEVTTNGHTATISSTIAGTAGIKKTGAGKLTLSGANTVSGTADVSLGTLEAQGEVLGNIDAVLLGAGGTLLFSGTGNRVKDTAGVTLAGGTLETSGLDEALGALTLSANSILDFGSGTDGVVTFASASGSWGGTLNILNWSGVAYTGGGTEQLRFTADPTAYLGQITFNGIAGAASIYNESESYYEVVPVPEPQVVFAALGLIGLVGWWERRRWLPAFLKLMRYLESKPWGQPLVRTITLVGLGLMIVGLVAFAPAL